MCEQFVARSVEPFRLDELWPFVERMEHWGIAGFGWGAAWIRADGSIAAHRDTRAFRDDPARDRVGAVETTSLLVHLRRPSRLSTLQLPDTQPFVDPGARFALSHNGELGDTREARDRYRAAGRIQGRADSEVAQRWLEDAWTDAGPVPDLLAGLHARFGGLANLAVLAAGGAVHHYAGNAENPLFAFHLGRIGIVSTALYSIDRSLFRYAAPAAAGRSVARPGCTIALDERGRPLVTGPVRPPLVPA